MLSIGCGGVATPRRPGDSSRPAGRPQSRTFWIGPVRKPHHAEVNLSRNWFRKNSSIVIAPCVAHIPLKTIPAHVIVIRDAKHLENPRKPASPPPPSGTTPTGTTLAGTTPTGTTPTGTTPTGTGTTPSASTPSRAARQALFLQVGDQIWVSRPARLSFSYHGNRYRIPHGSVKLACRSLRIGPRESSRATRVLAVVLKSGKVKVRAGSRAREALVLSPEMLSFATAPNTNFIVERNPATGLTSSHTLDHAIIDSSARNPRLRIKTRATYTALADRRGVRLNVWPFDLSRLQRPTTRSDRLPPYWADGQPCAIGCAAPGVIRGWPLRPFHQQHAIRAGIDELRPANFHVAVDIEANNYQPVFAIRSGYASVSPTGSYKDTEVTVGPFTYWHITPTVSRGQYVVAYKTEIGAVEHGFGHLAFSEGGDDDYLNPLRPDGPLQPYTDTEPPVIGVPRIFATGRVIVGAFDPQSDINRTGYLTPVLAPASLAWRLYNSKGRAITRLEWALRSSGYISPTLKPVIFAPGASNPGFGCFYTQLVCIPNWVYNLAGGLTEPLPLGTMTPGRYKLTIYAEDFKGNASALDYWFHYPATATASVLPNELGPLDPQYDP